MKQTILFQRLEAAVLLAAVTIQYGHLGQPWIIFAVLLFAPDISAAGYLKSNRFGAMCYNLGHSLALPLVVLTTGVLSNHHLTQGLGLIWLAHIGFDRMLGYGLKEVEGFQHTHLGKIGRK